MFLPCFFLTGVNAAIPWCTMYEVMVTVHFLKGFFLGFIDAGECFLNYLLVLLQYIDFVYLQRYCNLL